MDGEGKRQDEDEQQPLEQRSGHRRGLEDGTGVEPAGKLRHTTDEQGGDGARGCRPPCSPAQSPAVSSSQTAVAPGDIALRTALVSWTNGSSPATSSACASAAPATPATAATTRRERIPGSVGP
jgi:hypothetical protein